MSGRCLITVNVGSSSLRLDAFDLGPAAKRQAQMHVSGHSSASPEVLRDFVSLHGLPSPGAVAHRVVHGGGILTGSCLVTPAVIAEIDRLSALAPLHNPAALKWIEATAEGFGESIEQVAVFDTAYFSALPDTARHYAVPRQWDCEFEVRRYGFHGLAHQSMRDFWQRGNGPIASTQRMITLQLGGGCSAAALRGGRPVDTTMGFSPLEGLMMATRCGDLDPGAVIHLARAKGLDALESALNRESGLLGVSGLTGDMATLLASAHPRAKDAVSMFCYRVRKAIGSYLAVLGGVDVIVFGGGIGEHAAGVRAQVLSGMEWAGIAVDPGRNDTQVTGLGGPIHAPHSQAQVWVAPVDEAAVMASEAAQCLSHPVSLSQGIDDGY